eukprot:620831-Rhodomonas_salina.2
MDWFDGFELEPHRHSAILTPFSSLNIIPPPPWSQSCTSLLISIMTLTPNPRSTTSSSLLILPRGRSYQMAAALDAVHFSAHHKLFTPRTESELGSVHQSTTKYPKDVWSLPGPQGCLSPSPRPQACRRSSANLKHPEIICKSPCFQHSLRQVFWELVAVAVAPKC